MHELGWSSSKTSSASTTSTRPPTRRGQLPQQRPEAKELFNRDKDYIVRNGEVLIVDEFTAGC
ncbi:secA precross-linking domain protein [Mycobacterium ulcerans str. Harvey]|uniref:SecA precross-linking domain protein n=1 Tax=Mycobacterium ulcerans str. Harvey TaxID=1299332 RepID=A0ABN0R9J7_MYCUL|nr:secA precross-linking domain protein [Mycobacterium ulcerans str. Harvey]